AAEALTDAPNGLKKLRAQAGPDPQRRLIARSPRGQVADALAMAALLETPLPAAAVRAELYPAWRGLDGRLRAAAGEPSAGDVPAADPHRGVEDERRRGLARARVSLALLKLYGAAAPAGAEEALARARQAPHDPKAWAALGGELRRAWKSYD